jgi:anti-sigma B factor antagonist
VVAHALARPTPATSLRGGTAIDLSLDTSQHGRWTVVSVQGELDLYTAPQLREAVLGLDAGSAPHVAIDLSDVGFIDSSGLGAIIACLKHVREQSGELALVTPEASPLTKLLALTGLDAAVPTVASLEDAGA